MLKNRFRWGIVVGLIAGFILTTATFTSASQTVRIFVNGNLINPPVAPQIINGTTMVPLRSISEALNVPVSFDQASNSVIVGTPPKTMPTPIQTPVQQPQVQTPVQPVGQGNLKGTITWQYNNFVGTKGDVGAKIFLIPTNFNKNKVTDNQADMFAMIGECPNNSGLFFGKADGYGNYIINNIPTGEYILLIVSAKTTRNFTEPIDLYTKSLLTPVVKDYNKFEILNLSINKYNILKININKGDVNNFSHDFGNTFL